MSINYHVTAERKKVNLDRDLQIRLAAFDWLGEQADIHGDVLPRDLLVGGFQFQGKRIPLMSPQGIFKPAVMDLPLTITTAPEGPYEDSYFEGQFLQYRYRGTDPQHRGNVGLCKLLVPLIAQIGPDYAEVGNGPGVRGPGGFARARIVDDPSVICEVQRFSGTDGEE